MAVKVKIDRKEVEVEEGATIMQAAQKAGVSIPHFCYHEHLSLSGTCRLCLVEVEGIPKLQTACSTPVRDGMGVTTDSDKVEKARRAMLEFLLLNHPLDCPVCDKVGECRLQDYVFEFGSTHSRFEEQKRVFQVMDIGDRLARNMNRCIYCLRCVRFCREVAMQEDFGSFHRGEKKEVGLFAEGPVANNYSVNLVELCPVGALTSKDFRFKAKVWNLNRAGSVCPECSTGCNVNLWTKDNKIKRITPRENAAVNGHWMCDEGRWAYKAMEGKKRIEQPMIRQGDEFASTTWHLALEHVAQALRGIMDRSGPGRIGSLVSCRTMNEAGYLFRKFIREVIGTTHLDFSDGSQDNRNEKAADGILFREDRAPNRRGLSDMGIGPGEGGMGRREMLEAAARDQLAALVIMGADPLTSSSQSREQVSAGLEKLELLVVMDSFMSETAEKATVLLPTLAPFESAGTYTNYDGRVQRLNHALKPPSDCRADWEVIFQLSQKLGVLMPFDSEKRVMEEIVSEIPAYGKMSEMEPDNGGIRT